MKNIFFPLSILVVLASACGSEPSQQTSEPASALPANATTQRVIYKSCAVYAASTEFMFVDANGEQLIVQVANSPEERTTKIPDNMTDPNTPAEEGPPGANPALVGKAFLLVKNEKDEIIEIRPAE